MSNLFYKNEKICKSVSLDDTAFINNNLTINKTECIEEKNNESVQKVNISRDNCKEMNKVSADINTSLSSWGLPENILSKYHNRGITNMFKWQAECLGNDQILTQNSNLVYSAPTSAGKTLVAEILALKTVLEKQKKVIIILPFVSVVREKMFYFQDILASSGIRVEGFMGSHTPPGGFKAVQLAICTIEKANSIVNRLLEEGTLTDVGAVVIDEIHLLGDPSRGYILELLLTKLRYMSARNKDINIQLIGMSATLPNLELLSKWLDAQLYTTDFRPIPLYEFSVVMGEIYDNKFKLQRRLKKNSELKEDSDNILQLCLETISISCSVLIFCPTKNWCENLAQQISLAFKKLGMSDSKFGKCLREQLKTNAIMEVLEQLQRCPVGLDSVLKKTVSFGVAFHHAGLTMDERDIIEGAFRDGSLRVLVATSTLSSGVNLPAQRVIIRTPIFHGKPIDTLTYRQMIGRAGRMGKDSSGESVLVCQKNDKRIASELMSAKLHPIESCLEGAGKLKRALLEVIASGVATTQTDIKMFAECTLLFATGTLNQTSNPIEEAVQFLHNNEFIRLQKNENDELIKYVPTSLAKACLSSSMPPEDGLILFEEIEKARQCFVLDTDLHLLYLVTPYSVCSQWTNLDWMLYLDIWEKLPNNMRRVAELVGVRESYIFNATQGKINTSTSKMYHKLQIHRRFYTALALQDLVNEVPLNNVAHKFQCSRGMLQSLQQSASMFAGMVTSFCNQLRWKCVEILISQFQDRLQFGIQHELLDLMKLPNLNGPRARALYNAGIQTLTDLASFDICQLENVLHSSVPFQSEKERNGETVHDFEEKMKMRTIWITGKQGLTARDAAEMLINDARNYLQLEMGAVAVKWNSSPVNSNHSYTSGSTCTSESLSTIDSDHTSINNFKINNNNLKINTKCYQLAGNDVENDFKIKSLINKFSQHNIVSTNESKIEQGVTNPLVDKTNTSILENIDINKRNNTIRNILEEIDKSKLSDRENGAENKSQIDIINDVIEYNWTLELENEISSIPLNGNEFKLNNSSSSVVFNNSDNLFEDSLNLNSKLCDVLDTSLNEKSSCEPEKDKSELQKNDTLFLESSFSTFSADNELGIVKLNHTNDISADIIDTSIPEIQDSFKFLKTVNSVRKKKTKRLHRKRSRNKDNSNIKETSDNSLTLHETPRKKQKHNSTNDDIGDIKSLDENIFDLSEIVFSPVTQFKDEHVEPIDLSNLDIIPVCKDENLFTTFCQEIEKKGNISLTVACELFNQKKSLIGQNIKFSHKHNTTEATSEKLFIFENKQIIGVAISWGGNTVYYISFIDLEYIENDKKVKILRKVLNKQNVKVRIFDSKEQIKILYSGCNITLDCNIEDPKVADWLLDLETKEKNLQAMALKYAQEVVGIAQLGGNSKGIGSIGLDVDSSILGQIRAAVESIVVWHIIESQKQVILDLNIKLMDTFNTEMSTILCLTRMEITGLGVDSNKINNIVDNIQEQMNCLQKEAFQLAGRHFSFTSSKDVAMVLGLYKGKRVSTNKQTLEQHNNPISKIVIQWRKLSSTLTKMLFPLIRSLKNDRIHGCCITHSATGRISMHEPNLQNVPRNFDINKSDNSTHTLSVRSAFVPTKDKVFLSADYCQLELRILAHLSQDTVLCKIMRTQCDVFKSIAAKLNKLCENQVNDSLRQRAKQLCYGIIYGMGTKALSIQMDTSEEEATEFINTFSRTYPSIKQFVHQTIASCRELGYVESIAARRRYLPNINNDNLAIKGQAERQAVNTTIQGSAADIAKKAMILVEERIHKFYSSIHRTNLNSSLILHLHDELLYEVPIKNLKTVALLVKNTMENAFKLTIPLPIRIKTGPSWGELEEFHI